MPRRPSVIGAFQSPERTRPLLAPELVLLADAGVRPRFHDQAALTPMRYFIGVYLIAIPAAGNARPDQSLSAVVVGVTAASTLCAARAQ